MIDKLILYFNGSFEASIRSRSFQYFPMLFIHNALSSYPVYSDSHQIGYSLHQCKIILAEGIFLPACKARVSNNPSQSKDGMHSRIPSILHSVSDQLNSGYFQLSPWFVQAGVHIYRHRYPAIPIFFLPDHQDPDRHSSSIYSLFVTR